MKTKKNYNFLNKKNILVTGGTGSFGSFFVKTVLKFSKPKRLVIFSRDEFKQSELKKELINYPNNDCLRFFIGDVRNVDRLKFSCRDIEILIHAAALKQIDTAEYNPFECIETNIRGAENVVRASISSSIKKVIAISTDKAVNPINLYGASKLAADKIFISANQSARKDDAKFSVVRYGNVVGSRGSVIPYFYEIIKNLPDLIKSQYLQIWQEYQENNSIESKLVHQIDKLEMALQANIYKKDGHSQEKLESFFESARMGITDPKLKELFTKIIEDT